MAAAGVFSQDVQEAFGTVFGAADAVRAGRRLGDVADPWVPTPSASTPPRTPSAPAPWHPTAPSTSIAEAAIPAGGPGQPPPAAPTGTPDPNAPPTPIDAGTWDGTSYLSSGFVVAFPPDLYTYKVTFSKAGTYTYVSASSTPTWPGTIKVGS